MGLFNWLKKKKETPNKTVPVLPARVIQGALLTDSTAAINQVASEISKVETDLTTKLTADNIIAGSNITLNKSGNNITINSTGGSGEPITISAGSNINVNQSGINYTISLDESVINNISTNTSDISAINNDILTIKKDITDIDDSINLTIKRDIADIDDSISLIKSNIRDLNTTIETIKNDYLTKQPDYTTGWFSAKAQQTFTFYHNLGTTEIFYVIEMKNSDGSVWVVTPAICPDGTQSSYAGGLQVTARTSNYIRCAVAKNFALSLSRYYDINGNYGNDATWNEGVTARIKVWKLV